MSNTVEVEAKQRSKTIIKTSIIGVIANVLLAGFKMAVGFISHSIAIVLDAVNNISDVASSVVTVIGAKLATKAADKKHPFGHGRVEYLSAMIIGILVLYAGITALIEAIKKIITPETPDYSWVSLVIVGVAVLVKIVLGIYVRKTGVKVKSESLVNSGKDALMDSIISASTLVAAGVFMLFGVSLEAWLGAVISLFIIKAGFEMLKDMISEILGKRVDKELIDRIKETVCSFDGVLGAYDLVLNDYGPDIYNGSLHIGISDSMTADEIDELQREITEKVYFEHHVILTAIGVYAVSTDNETHNEMRQKILSLVLELPNVLQVHGFHVNEDKKTVRFDMVVAFEEKDRVGIMAQAQKIVKDFYPDYEARIVIDNDYGEF